MTIPRLSELPGDADHVLAGRPLRQGATLAATSRFVDDVWRLEPAILQKHVTSLTLNFPAIPDRYRLDAKQLCYAVLAGPLPPGEKRLSITTVRAMFVCIKTFLRWVDARPACNGRPAQPRLSDLTANDLEDYERYVGEYFRNPGMRENARRGVHMFWRYRNGLSDPLRINPRHVEGFGRAGARPRENATDRITEPVLAPLIVWSMRFVDSFSADILMAASEWRDYRCRVKGNGRVGRNDGVLEDIATYLNSQIDLGQPLPGHLGAPNWRFIGAILGVSRKGMEAPHIKPLFNDAIAKVGATQHTWLPMTVTGALDGAPWVSGIAMRHPHQSLQQLARLLQVSCYVLIAFFSGMRDSEIKHLHRGCLKARQDADGRTYRWNVTSLAFKGESSPAGNPATWVVGEPAARAVAVLEQLQPPEQTLLFAHLPYSSAVGPARAAANTAITTKATNQQLLEFMQWINTYCTANNRHDGIPTNNGKVPPLSSSRFRRTLAWFIARHPGGSIAGAIQYRHLSIQMFEGYCGTSESGFRAEVESEQALARGEYLTQMVDGHEHRQLRGPAADTAQRRLQEWGRQFGGAVITDNHQMKRLMRRADPAIYPGTFALCVFDPGKALCSQQRDTAGRKRPTTNNCQPLECSNVALTDDNITALRAEHRRLQHELAARPSLPPLLKHRLEDRQARITQFLVSVLN